MSTTYERVREKYREICDGQIPKLGWAVVFLLGEIDRLDAERRELAERVDALTTRLGDE